MLESDAPTDKSRGYAGNPARQGPCCRYAGINTSNLPQNWSLFIFKVPPSLARFTHSLLLLAGNLEAGDDLQYSFDASESFDKYQARGGGVVRYQFTVNEVELPLADQSSINFIFPNDLDNKDLYDLIFNDTKS